MNYLFVGCLFLLCSLSSSMAPALGANLWLSQANEVLADPAPQIEWLTWTEAIERMERDEKPKKMLVDLYTDWCGYCKKMDRETFSDPWVIKYVNEHFYAVKFNAEKPGDLVYKGHKFNYDTARGRNGVHTLAFALLDGSLSYPSMVYLDEKQSRIAISPGFKPADSFLTELQFIGGNHFKTTDYNTFKAKKKG